MEKYFDKLKNLIISFEGKTCTEGDVRSALTILSSIKDYTKVYSEGIVRYIDVHDIDPKWNEVGSGHFGFVYSSRYGGSKVAIKIFKEESKSKIREGKFLYSLSHENIIAFRGIGYISREKAQELDITLSQDNGGEMMFLVMEFINQNLLKYVDSMRVHERKGLPYDKAWDIGQQIASALNYLHSLDIAHRDLKPDNILLEVGPRRIVVKLADFGLATDGKMVNTIAPHERSTSCSYASSYGGNVRWGAPEVFDSDHSWTLDNIKAADMYCFGSVLAYALTGERPYDKTSTFTLRDQLESKPNPIVPDLPKSLSGCLRNITLHCLKGNPNERPSSAEALNQYFGQDSNPYVLKANAEKEVEFFTCGFMDKTDIFVADSCIDKEASQIGFYKSRKRATGYDHQDLQCPIEVEEAPYRDRPEEWELEEEYNDNLEEFLDLSKKKVIDNNPTVALKGLTFARPGDEECQLIEFKFRQSNYIHHRAMRKIWTELSDQQKNMEVPCKAEVHPYFSNTFGLHVAVLTNEGSDKPQKFLFPRRAQRAGMSSPGKFTCGAVESASKPDYIKKDSGIYVDLVNTAARGLQEELGLELSGEDLKAICLTTVYLKFDTHEWGLCGFVDLKDERIDTKHRLSAESLKDMFSTGPKDKFEHQTLTFIDFDLNTMIDFVFNNHENFASSAKLVVVKVLQAFYGWQRVQHEFEMRLFGK